MNKSQAKAASRCLRNTTRGERIMVAREISTSWYRLILSTGILCAAVIPISGCQQKMAAQPSYKTLEKSDFFDDGRSARPPLRYTVARGHLRIDRAFFTGRVDQPPVEAAAPAEPPPEENQDRQPLPQSGAAASDFAENSAFVDRFPVEVSESMIEHGYNRYMIYCVVCHDPLGTGRGRIVERGYTPPPSYHIDRLRNAPAGRIFAIITEGYGSMPSYADQIPPADRWAIVAYVRALQLSQHFPRSALTPEMEKALSTSLAQNHSSSDGAATARGDTP